MSRDPSETNQRLLAAALEVFAEVGYRKATLREICRRAGANIAAVNYHFRDKEQLYLAVLDRAVMAAGDCLASLAPDPADPPDQKLHHFIRQFLRNLLGCDRPVELLRLRAHEMAEPTPALDLVIEKIARPLHAVLDAIVLELLGADAPATLIRDCAASVLSQCSGYQHAQAIVERLHQISLDDPTTIDALADHIFRFSLGGIRALAQGPVPSAAMTA